MGNQLSRFDLIGGNVQSSGSNQRVIGLDRKLILHYLRVFLYNYVDQGRRLGKDSTDGFDSNRMRRVPSINGLCMSSTLDSKSEKELLEAVEFFYGPFGRVHDALKECQSKPQSTFSSAAIKPAPSFAADLVELCEIVSLLPLSVLEGNDLVDWTGAIEGMSAEECNLVTAAVSRMTRPERLFLVIDKIMASALHQHKYIDFQVLIDVQKLIDLLFPILLVIVHSTNDAAPSTLASANELLTQYESLYLIMHDLSIPTQLQSIKGFDRVDEDCDLAVNVSISLALLLRNSSQMAAWKGVLLGESLLSMLATIFTSNADLVQPLVSLLTAQYLLLTDDGSDETIEKICRLLNVFLFSRSSSLAEAVLDNYDSNQPVIYLLTSCPQLNQNPNMVRRILPRLLVTASGKEDSDRLNLSILLNTIRADISLNLFDEAYLLIVSNSSRFLLEEEVRRELVAELVQKMLDQSSSSSGGIRACLDGVLWKQQDWNVVDQVLSARLFATAAANEDQVLSSDRSHVMDLFQWHLDRKNHIQACVLLYSAAMQQTSLDSFRNLSGDQARQRLLNAIEYLLVLENYMLATQRDLVFEYQSGLVTLGIVKQKLVLMQVHLALDDDDDFFLDRTVSELVVMMLTRPKPLIMLALRLLEQFTEDHIDSEEMLYHLGWDSMLAFLVDKCIDCSNMSVDDEAWIAEFLISKWSSFIPSTDVSMCERTLLSVLVMIPDRHHPMIFDFVLHRFLAHADLHHQLYLPIDLLILFANCDRGNSLVQFVCQMYLSTITPHVPCVCNQLFAMLPIVLSQCHCQLTEESLLLLQRAIASDQILCFHHQS